MAKSRQLKSITPQRLSRLLIENKDGKLTPDELQPEFGGRGWRNTRSGKSKWRKRAAARERGSEGRVAQNSVPERGFQRGGPGGGAMNAASRLMGFDENKDGKISKDELPERMQPLMVRIDRDKDGFLSAKTKSNRWEVSGGRGPGNAWSWTRKRQWSWTRRSRVPADADGASPQGERPRRPPVE